MKPVIYNDVLASVAVVVATPVADQPSVARDLLRAATCAARYQSTHGHAHPTLGDGSLLAVALQRDRRSTAGFQTVEELDAWLNMLSALKGWMCQPDAQLIQRVAVGSSSRRFRAISSPQSSQ